MTTSPDPATATSEQAPLPEGGGRRATWRLVALVLGFGVVSAALHVSGWNGPERLQDLVESAGWAGVVVFVVGYAVLVLVPTPASVLTILAGALFGVLWGTLLAWAGALLGALGGFALGRRLGRPAVDRLLRGRLQQADRVLSDHGLVAVLAVRLLPLFPFTPVNYAAGLLGVRRRDYALGTAVGIVPGALAYAALGASGANPLGIAVGGGGLVALIVLGGAVGRRLLAASGEETGVSDDRLSSGGRRPNAGRYDA